MEDIQTMKQDLALASRVLDNEELAQGFGHISVRIKGTDKFLVPGHISPALVKPEHILTINLKGEIVEGKGKPNSETWIHTCIYRLRESVNSVSHFHSFHLKLLGTVGQSIQPIMNAAVRFADGVPLYVDPVLISTEKQGINLAQMLAQHNAILLRAHGATVVGEDLQTALLSSIALEESAKMQVWANMIGKPQLLNEDEIKRVRQEMTGRSLEERLSRNQRAWDYYVNKLPLVR